MVLEEKYNLAANFQEELTKRFPKLIKPSIEETETWRKSHEGLKKLPSISDIKAFTGALCQARDKAITALEAKITFDNYLILVESTFLLLQLFNRRRTSEMENLYVTLFGDSFEQFSEETHPDLFKTLSSEGKNQVKKFGRVFVCGKQNAKMVAVLIDGQNRKAISVLLIRKLEMKLEYQKITNCFLPCREKWEKFNLI